MCLIYSQENTGGDAPFRAVADIWAYSFSKRHSITDTFIWKFYRKSFLKNTAV